MECLFSPCTRLHDLLLSQGRLGAFRGHPEHLQELNLNVSTEELLSAERAFTYADLHTMNQNTVAWLTTHAAIACKCDEVVYSWLSLDESRSFCFSADGQDIVALARSPKHLLEICDVVVRLLAVSVVHSVHLSYWASDIR